MLGISLPTLYSYVSRGLLRSDPVVGQPRTRHYFREDILRLKERKENRHDPAKAAARGLHWGSPVLESSLTLIEGGRIYYRGLSAIELAQKSSVEEVAALLWTGDPKQASSLFSPQAKKLPRNIRYLIEKTSHLGPVERCQMVLPVVASLDFSAYDLRPHAVAKTGARILHHLLSAVCGPSASAPIDVVLQEAWAPKRQAATRQLRAALILCADHELNVSTFAARCIASARASPYEVVAGALAALKGQRHGGMTARVEVVFREAARARNLRQFLAQTLRLQAQLPGFGHPLYPHGDPRATLLLTLAQTDGKSAVADLAASTIEAARELTGEHPTLDFGLVVLAQALNLPPESPLALFAMGRTVGWIAHAIEQYADNQLIRPRARYVGVVPGS